MSSDRDALLEMGFSESRVELALRATKNAGLQPAMDWLALHSDDPEPTLDEGGQLLAAAGASSAPSAASTGDEGEITQEQATAQSLKCDDCGKLLRDANAAEFHAVKSGHTNFSESTSVIKPLSPEEKAAKLQELKEKLAAKREAKRLQEIEYAKAAEKVRRLTGQEKNLIREKLEAEEMKKATAASLKEKEEDRKAKQRIKALLEQDKLDRARAAAERRAMREGTALPDTTAASSSTVKTLPIVSTDYETARIQIRLPNGKPPLTHTFSALDPLSKVYDFVGNELGSPEGFKLLLTFPCKLLDGADRAKSLKDLGLVPSAALVAM